MGVSGVFCKGFLWEADMFRRMRDGRYVVADKITH
jgi:hypothetical protein